jgi:Ca2+-binding EF-hand superfamily protein
VTSLSSSTVTLRWLFSASFSKMAEELKRIFIVADVDQSGAINREELTAAKLFT